MLLLSRRFPVFTLGLLVWATLCQAEPAYWVFEGVITKTDESLVPDLQSGWVLSGSFVLETLSLEAEWIDDAARAGRFAGGITDSEITIDLYHQLHFEGMQVPGLAGFDYADNDPEAEGRDLYGWYLPIKGVLKDTSWSSRWLQVWLSDSEGEMIRVVPPAISPYGINWKAAWFRLTFENPQGELAYVDGRIEYFGPEANRENGEEDNWIVVAADLSRQLVERDQAIASLRDELASARARIESLRQMVDLLMVERQNLEEENALLEEKAEQADPEVVKTLASLTAEKALIQEELSILSGQNVSLEENLMASERDRVVLMNRIENLQLSLSEAEAAAQRAEARTPEPPPTKMAASSTGEPTSPPPIDARTRESSSKLPSLENERVVPEASESAEESGGLARQRRFGPRKFR